MNDRSLGEGWVPARGRRLSIVMERASEWSSSILVKETRQALRGKQFVWTYFALLIVAGVWTMLGLTLSGAEGDSSEAGPLLFYGFGVILGFPLGLIIPFGAYRSLAHEFDDGTIQLISITSMKPYQIIAGKLGSSVLQMLVYLSVLAPCITFTYLLRGINLFQIGIAMLICILGSLCLSSFGLFLASITRSRMASVGISVAFVVLLVWLYTIWIAGLNVLTFLAPNMADADSESVILFAFFAVAASTTALLFAGAASQISFPADNRSTLIRIMMLIQQTLLLAVFLASLELGNYQEVYAVYAMIFGHYWLVMGSFLAGESPELSRRVRRTLPQTSVTKRLFSLFYPGPGRGYLFAMANLWACTVMLAMAAIFDQQLTSAVNRTKARSDVALGLFATSVYASFFLTSVFLLVTWLNRFRGLRPGPPAAVIVALVLVVFATVSGLLIQYNFLPTSNRNIWSEIQILNWYWTCNDIFDKGKFSDSFATVCLFAIVVVIFVLVAVTIAARELLQIRTATPDRVLAEKRRTKPRELAPGESLDEIFGRVKSDEAPARSTAAN
jgi:hypothetical protein